MTHGFHSYPARFIPQIPNTLIKKLINNQNEIILDPMTGSGTSNVEAVLLCKNSIGLDINLFSVLLTKVKITPINPDILEKFSIIKIVNARILSFRQNKKTNLIDDYIKYDFRTNCKMA